VALAFAGEVSGGYFNSTVSIAAFLNKKHKFLGTYILAQIVGGVLGVGWFYVMTGKMKIVYQR
jgi:glycerol uptake facilitator-like aquaporin